jgi:hypothetical protein
MADPRRRGRPKKLQLCKGCGQDFGRREMQVHAPGGKCSTPRSLESRQHRLKPLTTREAMTVSDMIEAQRKHGDQCGPDCPPDCMFAPGRPDPVVDRPPWDD